MSVARSAVPSDATEALRSPNVLLAGTTVVSGEGRAVVFATGRNTLFGRISRLTQAGGEVRTPFLQQIAFVTRVIAAFAIGLGAVFFFVGREAGLSTWDASLFGVAIIVANVPKGLLPTITLALAMGARRMALRKVLIRHLPAVETLGSTTVICTEKTGTLTQNRMAARELFIPGHRTVASPDDLDPRAFEADRLLLEAAPQMPHAQAHGGRWLDRGSHGDRACGDGRAGGPQGRSRSLRSSARSRSMPIASA
jgi:magnesium-transporting ATPase (P-type)